MEGRIFLPVLPCEAPFSIFVLEIAALFLFEVDPSFCRLTEMIPAKKRVRFT